MSNLCCMCSALLLLVLTWQTDAISSLSLNPFQVFPTISAPNKIQSKPRLPGLWRKHPSLLLHTTATRPILANVISGITAKQPINWLTTVSNRNGQYCGGVMIATNLMLTAAHCLEEFKGISLLSNIPDGDGPHAAAQRVRSNVLDLSHRGSGELEYTVERVIHHPHHTKIDSYYGISNDIALWVLKPRDQENTLQYKCQEIIKLPWMVDSFGQLDHSDYHVAGWGVQPGEHRPSQKLKKLALSFPMLTLADEYYNFAFRKGVSQGDSGGPLYKIVHGEAILYGLTSRGTGALGYLQCTLSIYTKVDLHRRWIEQVARKYGMTLGV